MNPFHVVAHWLRLERCEIVRAVRVDGQEWLFLKCLACGRVTPFVASAVR